MTAAPTLDAIIGLKTPKRDDLWAGMLDLLEARRVAELGVWKGVFAEAMLKRCPRIERYYLIDPWRHLDVWNKPFNVDTEQFDAVYDEAMARTDFAAGRRTVLRGTTIDVIDEIADGSLDLAYVDGDHTLRGIAIDLIRAWPKVRPGGVLGGDDYNRSAWHHAPTYEPTLVCPFAAYFAEAVGAPMVVFPKNQYAILKPVGQGGFSLTDTTGMYGPRDLLSQMRPVG